MRGIEGGRLPGYRFAARPRLIAAGVDPVHLYEDAGIRHAPRSARLDELPEGVAELATHCRVNWIARTRPATSHQHPCTT